MFYWFQGMVVAILFCLINNEVMTQLKKFCGDRLDTRNNPSMAMTQYTVRNHVNHDNHGHKNNHVRRPEEIKYNAAQWRGGG
jgi:hypothetical protein